MTQAGGRLLVLGGPSWRLRGRPRLTRLEDSQNLLQQGPDLVEPLLQSARRPVKSPLSRSSTRSERLGSLERVSLTSPPACLPCRSSAPQRAYRASSARSSRERSADGPSDSSPFREFYGRGIGGIDHRDFDRGAPTRSEWQACRASCRNPPRTLRGISTCKRRCRGCRPVWEESSQNVLVDEVQIDQRGNRFACRSADVRPARLHLDLVDHLRRQQHLRLSVLFAMSNSKTSYCNKKTHRRGGVSRSDARRKFIVLNPPMRPINPATGRNPRLFALSARLFDPIETSPCDHQLIIETSLSTRYEGSGG